MNAAESTSSASSASSTGADSEAVKEKVISVLQTVFDPEIPVSIYELGLIYDIAVQPSGAVHIKMTLTAPGCPEAVSLPPQVEWRVKEEAGVPECKVEVVWEPTWTPEKMSEAARLQLGMM